MKKIYFLFILIFWDSCTISEKNVNSDLEIVNLNEQLKVDNGIDMESLVDSMRILKLETSEESLVGNIQKIIFTPNGNCIIGDDCGGHGIIIFDKNGKFIRRITSGNGNGELRYYADFDFDYETSSLIVGQDNYFMQYDENGKYLGLVDDGTGKPLNVAFYYSDFVLFKNYILFKTLFSQNKEAELSENYMIITDKSGTILESAVHQFVRYNLGFSKFGYYGQHFSIPLSDTIYGFENGHINAKFLLDYSEKKMSNIDYQNIGNFMKDAMNSEDYFFDGNFLETEKLQFIVLNSMKSYPLLLFRNKTTRELLCGNYMIFNHKIMPSFSCPFATTNDGYFVTTVDSSEENRELESSNLISEKEKNDIINLTDDDNPIIVLFKVKNEFK